MPSALSACGKYIVLSIPPTCRLQQVLGYQPPLDFVRAPPGLRALQPLDANGVYMAWESNRDIVTWKGETGGVLHHVSSQNIGELVSLKSDSQLLIWLLCRSSIHLCYGLFHVFRMMNTSTHE
jgi:hypothetical protein